VPQCPIACDANVGQVQESGSLTKVHGHETKNVTKVVGATSSECFLVVSIDALQSAVNAVVFLSFCLFVTVVICVKTTKRQTSSAPDTPSF